MFNFTCVPTEGKATPHTNLQDAQLFLQVTTVYMFFRLSFATRERGEKQREREQGRRECFVALKGPKIAPHTLTHTGVIVQQ